MAKIDPKEIIKQKTDRIEKAIRLEKPDRVPFCTILGINAFQASYAGYSLADVSLDPAKFSDSMVKLAEDFDRDLVMGTPGLRNSVTLTMVDDHPELVPAVELMTGQLHQILQDNFTKWPGIELAEDVPPQFIGGKFLEADEYDQFIENPKKCINEVIFPRAYRSLSNPNSGNGYGALIKWGQEMTKRTAAMSLGSMKLRELGYPKARITTGLNPYDFVADFIRNFDQAIMDFHRVPEKIEAAAEAVLPYMLKYIEVTTAIPPESEQDYDILSPIVSYPLHLNEFLNHKFYDNYYWPMMKKLLEADFEAGRIPLILFEGDHTPHLETILDLPKGKIIACFERPDWNKVAEIVKGHQCVMGGLSTSLMVTGTPQDIEEQIKETVELFDGEGFILSFSHCSLSKEAKVENMKAAVKTVRNLKL